MKIGELARETACSTPTIRYYEKIGLLPAPRRTDSAQRLYGAQDVRRLRFIRRCRESGFTLSDIAAFGAVARAGAKQAPCREIVERRLASLRAQLAKLAAVEARLVSVLREGRQAPPDSACQRLEAWGA
ncbi:MAG: MerR family transcriptional regulator [Ottowia sp.]